MLRTYILARIIEQNITNKLTNQGSCYNTSSPVSSWYYNKNYIMDWELFKFIFALDSECSHNINTVTTDYSTTFWFIYSLFLAVFKK